VALGNANGRLVGRETWKVNGLRETNVDRMRLGPSIAASQKAGRCYLFARAISDCGTDLPTREEERTSNLVGNIGSEPTIPIMLDHSGQDGILVTKTMSPRSLLSWGLPCQRIMRSAQIICGLAELSPSRPASLP
jgi:hypothetical protein